ncbi:CubicO group peptidase, beta-lactamase class C family [Geodermatophilus saharensis]|uniref:CubicO group peptidase, beta-lactamase class C family n=1 Tax=Geodermatophilus saharensis TaxID=1137994 RepID=A0A239A238_9ACTN|nr:serine hydrolase domain-containing protein [Geodermatophilus saharensis]SNR89148.1 CubicO group peptidase, beta-lactamase class C family [Geodermatophilus saharensis]
MSPTSSTRPAEPTVLDDVRGTVTELMTRHRVPGLTVAVTGPDRLLAARGYGYADLATRRPATADTGYPWFSMSKIATATVAMRLADEDRLDLDAPVCDLVPRFAARSGEQPRVRQLLDHTAGAGNPLPVRWVLPADAPEAEVDAVVRRVSARHDRPTRPAGAPARYSNLGYLVLAEVLATVTGERFTDHVRRVLLQPAGMTATGYAHRPGAEYATGYVRLPRPLTPVLRAVLPSGIVGDRHGEQVALRPFRVAGAGYGGLVGTATDAARLLRLHLAEGTIDGTRVLTAGSARAMRTIATPGRPFDLGLGWFRRPADRHATPGFVEHWGTGGGFWNAMRLYPDLGLGVVVMANTTRAYDHHALMTAVVDAVTR